jgi:hypothetical protein
MPCGMCVAAMVRPRIESSDLAPRPRACRGLVRVRRHDRDGSRVIVASAGLPGPGWRAGPVMRSNRRGPRRRPKMDEAFAAGERAFLNENQATTCSRSRAQLRLTSEGSPMPDSTQSSDGVITKPSSKSVAQTIDGLRRLIADRGFTVFNVIDHSGVAERAGVQMPDSKLVMFGKPSAGAAVMVAAPACRAGYPAQGAGLAGQERSGISELQRTGVPGRAAPPGGCPACALRRSAVDR